MSNVRINHFDGTPKFQVFEYKTNCHQMTEFYFVHFNFAINYVLLRNLKKKVKQWANITTLRTNRRIIKRLSVLKVLHHVHRHFEAIERLKILSGAF